MRDWTDDLEDHHIAVAEAEAWDREQDYQQDMADAAYLDEMDG